VVGSGGRPLDARVRADMEARLGSDFSSVRIHTGTGAAQSAAGMHARAYTVGNAIVFGAGGYAPATSEGRRTLAHELVHVQQQRRGQVAGTDAGGGIAVSDPGDRFERQAVSLADRALQSRGTPGSRAVPSGGLAHSADAHATAKGAGARVQRQFFDPVPLVVTPQQPGQPVEINAVDDRQEASTAWYKPWRYTGPLTGFFRGDVSMTNVSTMVDAVLKFAGARLIKRLNVIDHGNEEGVEIGDDWLTGAADVKRLGAPIAKVKGHFTSDGFVHMQNCHAGQNQTLICALADTFGVPVFAGTGFHNPLLGFNFGDYVSCSASGKWNPDAGRPSTPPAPPQPLFPGQQPAIA
jgi:hypothetical protein